MPLKNLRECMRVSMYAHVCVRALACFYLCAQTCCKARWMSMPCPHGAGGLARHSPALPLREMSILCLLKFWKAVDITFTPSYVRAPVYCEERADWSNKSKHSHKKLRRVEYEKSGRVAVGE